LISIIAFAWSQGEGPLLQIKSQYSFKPAFNESGSALQSAQVRLQVERICSGMGKMTVESPQESAFFK
jgi:hypothetical protein